jgi:hypothetical protein
MNRRRLHDYDDGFDEANLWGDDDWDLYGDREFENLLDINKQLDFEDTEVRYRIRAERTRSMDRGTRTDRYLDNRRRERKRPRSKSWDESH